MIKRAKGLAQFILEIGAEEGKKVERGKRNVYDVVTLKVYGCLSSSQYRVIT